MKNKVISAVEEHKIIAILRGIPTDKIIQTAEALYDGGIRLIEITYSANKTIPYEKTSENIQKLSEHFGDRLCVGAGTVITPELVELAARAGAKYIISPDTNISVIKRTNELGLVSMPGALTPTEILTAHYAGADFVKLFPVGNLGTGYIKAVCAPISNVKLLGVGGVNEDNVAEFIRAGVVGVGAGGNLANKKWVVAGEFDKLTDTARKMVENMKNA